MMGLKKQDGFSLVELIAVLIIVGLLAATATSTLIPSTSFQLQASRDQIVTAFFSAQQKAMTQQTPVAVVTSAGQVDIRMDSNGNNTFDPGESITVGGVNYPIPLLANQSLPNATFRFNRLGYTTPGSVTLSQSGANVAITVTATGYTY